MSENYMNNLITRECVNKNIKYNKYNTDTISYDYAHLSSEIDRFKNILQYKYKAYHGQTVMNALNGLESVALFFATAELGLVTAVTSVTRFNKNLFYKKRYDIPVYIDAKTEAILPIDYYFSSEKGVVGDLPVESKFFAELSDNVILLYDDVELDSSLVDYTPNDNIFARSDSIIMECTSSGTTGKPKLIKHTHEFISYVAKRNSKSFYGGVMATRRFHHGSSFATFFLPSLMSEDVERLYYMERFAEGKPFRKRAKYHNLPPVSLADVDHIQFAYTKDVKQYLEMSDTPYPNLIVYTLSTIDPSWSKYLGYSVKDIVSLFGSSETSGPILIQNLSDKNFEIDRFIDPDGFYLPEVIDDKLLLVLPSYDVVANTGDKFERNDDESYKFCGRNDKVVINNHELYLGHLNSIANEYVRNCLLVIDNEYDKVYLAVWEDQEDLHHKFMQLYYQFEDRFEVSRFAVLDQKIFLSGIKIDNEAIRDYFRYN